MSCIYYIERGWWCKQLLSIAELCARLQLSSVLSALWSIAFEDFFFFFSLYHPWHLLCPICYIKAPLFTAWRSSSIRTVDEAQFRPIWACKLCPRISHSIRIWLPNSWSRTLEPYNAQCNNYNLFVIALLVCVWCDGPMGYAGKEIYRIIYNNADVYKRVKSCCEPSLEMICVCTLSLSLFVKWYAGAAALLHTHTRRRTILIYIATLQILHTLWWIKDFQSYLLPLKSLQLCMCVCVESSVKWKLCALLYLELLQFCRDLMKYAIYTLL